MDKPFKLLGRSHRILFHDPVTAYVIASRLYPGDPNAVLAAQYHILCDNACSSSPKLKKSLETLARLNRKRKRKKSEKTAIEILTRAIGL